MKKTIRVINYKSKHTHVEPLLREMKALQINDLYKAKVFASLNKSRTEVCPEAIQDYCKFNDESSRRWFHTKTQVKLNKLQRSLPLVHQCKAWNEMISPDSEHMLRMPVKNANEEFKRQTI